MTRNNPLLLSALSGFLLAMSWPTYGFPLFIFIAFVPLFLVEIELRNSARSVKLKVWANGYLSFLIWNMITTWWLFYASVVGMLFAVFVNSLLMSLLFVIYHLARKKSSQNLSLILFSALWISFEKFHLVWDFSWPWLNLGNVFGSSPKWIQWYEFTGTSGGSVWVLAVNCIVFVSVKKLLDNKQHILDRRLCDKFALFVGIPIVVSLWMYYSYETIGKGVEVVVLQPNVDPYNEKYYATNYDTTVGLLAQADAVKTSETKFIVAPETVLAESAPLNVFEYSPARKLLRDYLSKNAEVELLWGIDSYDIVDEAHKTISSNKIRDFYANFYNAAIFVGNNRGYQTYYKSKLVVGIENLPYKPVLEPLLGNIMLNLGGTISTKTTQKERIPFTSKTGLKVAPIICYESVYGEFVTGFVKNGAQFMTIITNDAWWNDTQGHKQHLTFASLRAIECRRDIARSANTGISAFIDQRGNITSRTKYDEKIALKGNIHLNDRITFYVKHGDIIAYLAIVTMILSLGIALFSKKRNRT